MPFALVRWYVRALGSPSCPLGVLFSAGGSSTGTARTHRPASRGVVRGGAKDPTDDPAELDVLF
jgi:hypothetical protein